MVGNIENQTPNIENKEVQNNTLDTKDLDVVKADPDKFADQVENNEYIKNFEIELNKMQESTKFEKTFEKTTDDMAMGSSELAKESMDTVDRMVTWLADNPNEPFEIKWNTSSESLSPNSNLFANIVDEYDVLIKTMENQYGVKLNIPNATQIESRSLRQNDGNIALWHLRWLKTLNSLLSKPGVDVQSIVNNVTIGHVPDSTKGITLSFELEEDKPKEEPKEVPEELAESPEEQQREMFGKFRSIIDRNVGRNYNPKLGYYFTINQLKLDPKEFSQWENQENVQDTLRTLIGVDSLMHDTKQDSWSVKNLNDWYKLASISEWFIPDFDTLKDVESGKAKLSNGMSIKDFTDQYMAFHYGDNVYKYRPKGTTTRENQKLWREDYYLIKSYTPGRNIDLNMVENSKDKIVESKEGLIASR